MFVWRELEESDVVTIKRERDQFIVRIDRANLRDEQRVSVREVQFAMDDMVVTLVRRVLQRLKNNQR